MSQDLLSPRVALVTGASRGIGRATAIRLAQDFSTVAIVARSREGLAQTAEHIHAAGAQALALPFDLRQPDAAGQAVASVINEMGRLDAVATIAGDVSQKSLFELDDEDWHDSLMLKFHAMRRMIIAAWPHLRQTGGAVAITSGSSALAPKASFAAVGAINAMILSLARCFAEVGQSEGVRVNSVSPGPVMTDRRRAMLARYAMIEGLSEAEVLDRFIHDHGIVRFGQPEDVAEVFAWLMSPAASWIYGANIRIDGGELKMLP